MAPRADDDRGRRAFGAGPSVVERMRLAAYAWCETDGAVLLCRIASDMPGAGHWTLPGGGLRFGEDPALGVVRELREETGFEGDVGELLAVRSTVLEPGETKSGHRIHAVGLLYRIGIVGGSLRHETDESTDQAARVPVGDLDGLPTVKLVRWARRVVGR